ncbi:MAG: hypothetical protein ACTSQN_17190 [Candidatus Heimdallarchaeota archaeon]
MKKEALNLLKDLIIKSAEIQLHISEHSFRVVMNVHESRLVIYDRGGELGNTTFLFREFQKIEKQMRKLIRVGTKNLQSTDLNQPLFNQVTSDTVKIVRLMLTLEEDIK